MICSSANWCTISQIAFCSSVMSWGVVVAMSGLLGLDSAPEHVTSLQRRPLAGGEPGVLGAQAGYRRLNSPNPLRRSSARDAFETDRERDADTLQDGYRTLRITYARLRDRADAEAARLRLRL